MARLPPASKAILVAAIAAVAACGRIGFDDLTGMGDSGAGSDGAASDGEASDGGAGDGSAIDGTSSSVGYFIAVLVNNADLGGLTGANAWCLSELQSNAWFGKSTAVAGGLLTAGNVEAWLCDSTTCQDLEPSGSYSHGSTVQPTIGGYVATANGVLYPNDGMAWEEALPLMNFEEFYTGRSGNDTPLAETCLDFTSSSSADSMEVGVSDTPDYTEKRSKYFTPCNEDKSILCMVHPP